MPYAAPQPFVDQVSPIVANVNSLVSSGFGTAQNYANQTFSTATSFLGVLQGVAGQLTNVPNVNATLSAVGAAIAAYASPALPVEPDGMTLNLPQAPGQFTAPSIAQLSVGNAPEFTQQAPTLELPSAPAPLTASVPVLPTLSTVTTPDAPVVTIPDVPSLRDINIPAAPTLNLPSFSATIGAAPDAPGNTFTFTESDYASSFLTDLRGVLAQWVDGTSTGLSPAVEAALWQRGRDREAAAASRSALEVTRGFASRGWKKPPGVMALELQAAAQAAQTADITASREIGINQANLEQSNRRFAIEQALASEAPLIQYKGQIQQRAFETAKYAQQVALDIFQGLVQRYATDAQVYATKAQVYKTEIDAELSKLEVMKAQLEAQKLIGELNTQTLEVYRTRVAAIGEVVNIFKTRVDAANVLMQGNRFLLEGFADQVQAYDAQVRAKATEYQGYEAQTRAQGLRMDFFRGSSEAYRNVVEGFKVGVDARARAKDIELETLIRAPLEAFKSNAEIYRSIVGAEGSRLDALTKIYGTRGQIFAEQVRGEVARVNSEVEQFKAESDVAVAEGNLRLEAAKANVQKMMQAVNALAEIARAGSGASAQLAAAALSAVHLSAGMSASGGATATNHTSNSTSLQASSSESFDTRTSTNTSTEYRYEGTIV